MVYRFPGGLWLLSLIMFSAFANASEFKLGEQKIFGQDDFLPVDEAFRLSVIPEQDHLTVLWQVQPGYYLYRHRLSVEGAGLGEPRIPEGRDHQDEYFGDVQIYEEILEIEVPFLATAPASRSVVIEYQGCAKAGICYPPQKRTFQVGKEAKNL